VKRRLRQGIESVLPKVDTLSAPVENLMKAAEVAFEVWSKHPSCPTSFITGRIGNDPEAKRSTQDAVDNMLTVGEMLSDTRLIAAW
jgi:hypothetical protein